MASRRNVANSEEPKPRFGPVTREASKKLQQPEPGRAELTVDDLGEVQEELYGARTHWYNMGLKLGLKVDTLDTIRLTCSGDPSECFREMLKGYLQRVTPVPSWRALVEVLRSPTVNEPQLAEKVEQKYCVHTPPTDVQVSETVPDEELKSLAMQISTIDSDEEEEEDQQQIYFGCGCGKCSFDRVLEEGCPKPIPSMGSFPYLNPKGLSDSKQILISWLYVNHKPIKLQFAHLVCRTCRSLVQQLITVKELLQVIQALDVCESTQPKKPLFEERREELNAAKDIDDIFIILKDYYSFFGFDIIKFIIRELGTPEDKARLHNYEAKFSKYLRRVVFECPPTYSSTRKDQSTLIFLVDGSDVLKYTDNHIKILHSRISKVSPSSLRLYSVEQFMQCSFQCHCVLAWPLLSLSPLVDPLYPFTSLKWKEGDGVEEEAGIKGGSGDDTKPGAGVKQEGGVAKWESGAEPLIMKMKDLLSTLEEMVAKREEQLLQCEETIQMYQDRHQKQLQQMESVMAENEQLRKQIRTVEEGALVPTGESTTAGDLRGVDVIGETTLSVTNEAQTFHWAGYGLKLHIPPASLPAGVEQSSIDIKASLAGQFSFPENTTLVSAVYWLHSPVEFSQPIAVEIQHCATPNDDPSLTFARASQEDPPYKFTALEGGLFPHDSWYACIHLNRFSFVATVKKLLKSLLPQRRYCAHVYYAREAVSIWMADFVITHHLEACITAVRDKYSGAKAGPKLGVTFEGEEIALNVQREGFTVLNHWTITPLAHPGIAKEDVDSFKPGLQLPSCQLELKWSGGNEPVDLTYMVELQGAKKPNNFFHILLHREILQADTNPPVRRSSRKRRQKYTGVEGDGEKGREEGLGEGAENDAGPSVPKRSKQSRGKGTKRRKLSGSTCTEDLALKYPAGMESEPKLSDLMDQVAAHTPDKWRVVGIALGLTMNDLECFSVATTGDPSRCFCSVFTLWRSRMTREPYSWGTVVQALRAPAVGELRLAGQLEKRLTKPH